MPGSWVSRIGISSDRRHANHYPQPVSQSPPRWSAIWKYQPGPKVRKDQWDRELGSEYRAQNWGVKVRNRSAHEWDVSIAAPQGGGDGWHWNHIHTEPTAADAMQWIHQNVQVDIDGSHPRIPHNRTRYLGRDVEIWRVAPSEGETPIERVKSIGYDVLTQGFGSALGTGVVALAITFWVLSSPAMTWTTVAILAASAGAAFLVFLLGYGAAWLIPRWAIGLAGLGILLSLPAFIGTAIYLTLLWNSP